MSASVKIMLSYDYCHFEISKGSEQELTNKEINEMRKDVQRLADEAVRQYKKAKEVAQNINNRKYIERDIKEIQSKLEGDRTINEVARLKEYEDEKWEAQFVYNYDDDENLAF